VAVKRSLVRAVDWLDDRLAAVSLARRRERPGLLGFLFHGVFASRAEVEAGANWPAQPLLAEELGRFIEYFLAQGYRFVSPADVLAGLDTSGHYALLTFDDGYANNLRALPVLASFAVPATFFVSARHVAEGRAFWWDVVYRERRRRGASFEAIRREVGELRRLLPEEIEAQLHRDFGPEAMRPIGDGDRPLTAEELRTLARHPLVTVGNHGATHPDLTRVDAARLAAEIGECQVFLEAVTGAIPVAFAYPDGRFDERAIRAASEAGLRLAVTTRRAKAHLPLTPGSSMAIPRMFLPCGDALLTASARSRSDLQLRRLLERWR
jgi:peptidoglycan/xylan/chitin deacetylase (PgdA/CDA1 family)